MMSSASVALFLATALNVTIPLQVLVSSNIKAANNLTFYRVGRFVIEDL